MKIKPKQLRYMTLLELIIASTLTIILLMVLGYFYRQSILLEKESERQQKESFHLRYVETRLMQVIPLIERQYMVKNKEHFYFFTDHDLGGLAKDNSSSLVFVYQTNSDIKPAIAMRALGRLYLDKDQRLILATWPAPDTWDTTPPIQARIEVLLENVNSLKFKFFNPPVHDIKKIAKHLKGSTRETVIDSTDAWLNEWKQEYFQLPPLMKMLITYQPKGQPEQALTYAFPLPKSTKVIVYP